MTSIAEKIDELAHAIQTNVRNPSPAFWKETKEKTAVVLEDAIKYGVENEANLAWFLDTNSQLRLQFIECIDKMKKEEYYSAWCELERIEIGLSSLRRNA